MAEELNPFTIDENTKPTIDDELDSWYLIKRGERYSGWLWKSKCHKVFNGKKWDNLKKYVITDIENDDKVVHSGYLLEDMLVKIESLEKAKEVKNEKSAFKQNEPTYNKKQSNSRTNRRFYKMSRIRF